MKILRKLEFNESRQKSLYRNSKNSFTFFFSKISRKKCYYASTYFFFLLSKHRAFFITSKSYTIFCLKMARAIIIYNVQLFVYNFCQLFVFIWEVLLFSVTKKIGKG